LRRRQSPFVFVFVFIAAPFVALRTFVFTYHRSIRRLTGLLVSGTFDAMRHLRAGLLLALVIHCGAAEPTQQSGQPQLVRFQKIQATDQFWSEGAHHADFNRDGHGDIASGPFWYAGPDFKQRHEYRPAEATFIRTVSGRDETIPGFQGALGAANAYSDNFFTWTADLNSDAWPDILVVGMPGENAFWFENPRGRAGHWTRHVAFDVTDNESPEFTDLTGDGKPELVCNSKGCFGYASPDWSNPGRPWAWHAVTPNKNYHKYTHGLGLGDVNGDGRTDLIEKDGWWEQPASLDGDPAWIHHPVDFAPADPGVPVGSAQMFAYDVNGDGLNDVITCLAAHGYGLAWYEQITESGQIRFKPHVFMNKLPRDNKYGVKFTQPHALALTDIDGDGLKDLVTGKRFWAHGPDGDPEPNAPAVLYWFRLTRGADRSVDWVPYLIDDNSGVGTQVVACDVNVDQLPDVIVGNKKGTFVFLQERRSVSPADWQKAQPALYTGN
jgi:hypothetical protein